MTNFGTTDLSLAAAIYMACGAPDIERIDRGRVKFWFMRSEGLDALLVEFWNGTFRVEPKQYFAALKELKTRIYQG